MKRFSSAWPKREKVNVDWNDIVCEHGATVFGVAWRILGHAGDAEDVVQEVFLEVQQSTNSKTVTKWASFLRRVATFRALDRLRQRKSTSPIDDSMVASGDHDPAAIAIGNELEAILRESITRLPKQQAAVFCLRYFEDLSHEQIAHSLNISAAAASTTLHKARCKLKTLLVDMKEDE